MAIKKDIKEPSKEYTIKEKRGGLKKQNNVI